MIDVSKIYDKAFNDIINDSMVYMNYIKFISKGNIYNFSFCNQILMYAQKRESQYVAFYTDWQKIGRIPKKHSAIYITNEPNFKNTDTHVFALQDTVGQPFYSAWTCDENVRTFLNESIFDASIKQENFKESVKNLTRTYVRDILKIDNELGELSENILAYVILNRCNVTDITDLSENIMECFAQLSVDQRFDFLNDNQPELITQAKKLLNTISKIVRKEGIRNERINRQGTGFNKEGTGNAANATEGSRTGTWSNGNHNESEQRRNHSEDRPIRSESNGILRGEQLRQNDVSDASGETSANRSEESGESQESNERDSEGVSGRKSEQSDGFLNNSESKKPSENDSRRNGDERGNLSTTVEEYSQIDLFNLDNADSAPADNTIQLEDDEKKYSYINRKHEDHAPMEYVEEALRRGSLFAGGYQRIYKFFMDDIPASERANLIKNEYGIGGCGIPVENIGFNGFDSSAKGLKIQWVDEEGCKEAVMSWSDVEKEIGRLIRENRYLPDDQIDVADIVNTVNDDKEYMVYDINDDNAKLASVDGENTVTVKKEECYKTDTSDDMSDKALSGEVVDFHYPIGWELSTGSDRERFGKNIEAIQLLKTIENEHRYATAEEQNILSHYVGWGGLSNAFDEQKWPQEYSTLKGLLTDDEYKAARASVTDSFYTPPEVIDSIYNALDRMGFDGGNILEPACGIGNFFSAMPGNLRENSKLYGIELDFVSQKIAQFLHPTAKIENSAYEKSTSVGSFDNFYDVAIGNVPFGDYKIHDKRYKDKLYIHDYFFEKTLDKVVPGGLVCFITSTGTLDKANEKVRRYIAERADLVGAIRLPVDTFSKSANTQTTTDILFLKKRDSLTLCEPDWIHIGEYADGMMINNYFIEHPEMMLGELKKDISRYGEDRPVIYLAADKSTPLHEQLQRAVENLPENIFVHNIQEQDESLEEDSFETIPAVEGVKNNTFAVIDDVVYMRNNSVMERVNLNHTAEERIKGLCGIRSIVKDLIAKELSEYTTDDEIKAIQDKLNTVYDAFVKKIRANQ